MKEAALAGIVAEARTPANGSVKSLNAEISGYEEKHGLKSDRLLEELSSGEREEVRVPKRREEVEVERTSVEGESREVPEAEIGEEEFLVQVFEEEVVVSKRVVLKEEIWLRKKVVEDEEVVEVDLRKEEVEIEDQTERGAGRESLG